MNLRWTHHLAAIGFTAMTALAHAAPNPLPSGAPDAGALQQGLQKQMPQLQPLPTPKAPTVKPKPQEAKPSEVRVTIKGFRIDGNKSLSEELIKESLKPWLGQTVAFQDLQKAADTVAALYQTQGKLAQVSVPPQKITDGIIILKVLEAKLGAVHIDMPNGPSRFTEDRARRYVTDANRLSEIVQTQNIERSIYILNETPGIAVATQIEPGKNEGDVDLRVSLVDTKPVRGRLEANNYGNRSTGMGQRIINVTFDNPGTFGDQLSASNIKSSGSDYSVASYSVPLNSDGLRASVTGSYLDFENVGQFAFPKNEAASFGRAKTIGMNLSYPLLRSPSANANFSMGGDRKMYINKAVQSGEATSDYRIENMVFTLSGNRFDGWAGGGVNSASATLTKGHLTVGSQTPDYAVNTPKTFTKINLNASRNQQLVPDKTILSIAISGQIASVDLDSAERFYLGGPNGIRAYPGSQAGGSQGAMINIEIQQQLEDKFVGSIFYDAGFVQQFRNKATYIASKGVTPTSVGTNADNSYSLQGIGLGLKRADKDFIFSTSIAWKLGHNPLYNIRGVGVNNDGRSKSAYIWAQAQWIF
ncbi:ShlB/FhaC/HecB family hemolysin secretion/activation protein [Polynucleobacter sp. MWH-CaK5]|uniref:ShlB/FhaC/HecB family hemolysin secretion/activation protein n=1 Tax=Polynucleobacter sp. MWH-CaK5 TaxID=2689107 RepID=UPI001BFD26AB|nr:ShlB/FhaC/HecB family hemolysin secretion/activation protein [Polynucleobacter sp. MWH-CaK5]QWD88190.1 ShlB/FhaC/HecB family hemolysin secretion/activation protein [Polynucleobacter sp. MWH-CaK5]